MELQLESNDFGDSNDAIRTKFSLESASLCAGLNLELHIVTSASSSLSSLDVKLPTGAPTSISLRLICNNKDLDTFLDSSPTYWTSFSSASKDHGLDRMSWIPDICFGWRMQSFDWLYLDQMLIHMM